MKTLRICTTLVLLAVSTASSLAAAPKAAPLPVVDIPYQKFVLDNGLTLIVHEDHKAPVVAVNVPDAGGAGSRAGTVGRPLPGISAKVVDPDTGHGPLIGKEGLLLVTGPNHGRFPAGSRPCSTRLCLAASHTAAT